MNYKTCENEFLFLFFFNIYLLLAVSGPDCGPQAVFAAQASL